MYRVETMLKTEHVKYSSSLCSVLLRMQKYTITHENKADCSLRLLWNPDLNFSSAEEKCLIFSCVCNFTGTMNYARFLTAVSGARKPSPIRLLSEFLLHHNHLSKHQLLSRWRIHVRGGFNVLIPDCAAVWLGQGRLFHSWLSNHQPKVIWF